MENMVSAERARERIKSEAVELQLWPRYERRSDKQLNVPLEVNSAP